MWVNDDFSFLGINYSFKYESLMYVKPCKMYKISSENVILAQNTKQSSAQDLLEELLAM